MKGLRKRARTQQGGQQDPDAEAGAAGGRAARRRVFPVVSGVVIVTLLVLMSLLLWQRYGADGGDSTAADTAVGHSASGKLRSPFIDAAETVVLGVTNVTPDTIQSSTEKVLDRTTGEFHQKYKESQGQYVALVGKAQANSKGTIVQSGLESVDGDTGTVLLVVSTEVTNKSVQSPSTRDFRLRVTVVKDGDSYKVSNLAQVV